MYVVYVDLVTDEILLEGGTDFVPPHASHVIIDQERYEVVDHGIKLAQQTRYTGPGGETFQIGNVVTVYVQAAPRP